MDVRAIQGTRAGTETAPPTGPGVAARLDAELPRLRALVRRLLGGGAHEADDLSQEAAARALAHAGRFDPARPLWPWLRGIAVRVVIDHLGRRPAAGARAELASETADPQSGAEAAARELREELARRLSELSEVQRTALLRFHRDGLSVVELARELAMPVGTVKSHLHRARRRLAEKGGDLGRPA